MTDLIYYVKEAFPQLANCAELALAIGTVLMASASAYLYTRSTECLLCFIASALYGIPLMLQ